MPTMRFAFGINEEAFVAELRDLADKVEARSARITKVSIGQEACRDDFGLYTMTVQFAEKNPAFDPIARQRSDETMRAMGAEPFTPDP
jgi:hypothetical protein